MLPEDSLDQVLYIDLGKKSFRVASREDLFASCLGGAGVAAQLLLEECPEGCDPLGSENPIILAVGPLTGLFPLASKTVAMFKSPLTGNLGESHCGGRSATAIRMAGFGAIVITGASSTPVYLVVSGNEVQFEDATSLWGMESCFTVGRVLRERERGAGLRSIMRIGRAGENLVSYASVTTETYRHFGRLGLGAVFGSKKLKALVVSGSRSLPVADIKSYRKLYDEIYTAAVSSDTMKKYHDLGTSENVLPLNELGGLPTRNLMQARFEEAATVSGEHFAEHYLGRRLACSHCPTGCIHLAALREPYDDEPYFYKTSMICYDYEPVYAIGAMLGIGDARGLLKLMDKIEALGMDVMSTGVVLAWATEALDKGIITTAETGGVQLSWGDYAACIEAAEHIVESTNDLYRALACGAARASERYGGGEFALTFGGNEMPGYHTGPAAHAGYLVGARHSHLDNGGYSFDQKVVLKRAVTPEETARALLDDECWRQVLSSLVVCFFARGLYLKGTVVRALGLAGHAVTEEDLQRIGTKIHREKYRFKFREGFSLDTMTIPDRVFETATPAGLLDRTFLENTIRCVKQTIREG